MGFFSRLFGGRDNYTSNLPPEMTQLFEKIYRLMEDEDLQNSIYPVLIRDQIVNGLDVDCFPHGLGEYGRTPENPIPVNGVLGELLYLSLLKTQDANQRLMFHRLGSVESLDMYETVTIDGVHWDLFFFSMYHPKRSRKAPTGYSLADPRTQPLLYGTNRRVAHFPYGLQEAIRQTTSEIIGIPVPPPQVRRAEEQIQFQRPKEHEMRIRTAAAHVQGYRS